MNDSELARKVLEWEEIELKRLAIEAEIVAAVKERKTSLDIGSTHIRYSKGARSFDWKAAAAGKEIDPKIVEDCTTENTDWQAACEEAGVDQATIMRHTTPSINWTEVCSKAGIKEAPVLKQEEPSVKITLKKVTDETTSI